MVPQENVYIRKINLQKSSKSRKVNEENFCTRLQAKSYKVQETMALPFVVERNVAKALISVENLRQSWNQSRHHKR